MLSRAYTDLYTIKEATVRSRVLDFHSAKLAKKDEFYTQINDIDSEVKHYCKSLKGKKIYLNCDDPRYSNFFKYFVKNFNKLELKSVIASGYAIDGKDGSRPGIWAEYNGLPASSPSNYIDGISINFFKENGDFMSKESIALLEKSDVVITNPPFSLFREHIAQIMQYKKEFLILGNMNALTYKEIFPLFKENLVRYGKSIRSGDREFEVPKDYPLDAAITRIDEKGARFIRVKGVRWFTNIPSDESIEYIPLIKKFSNKSYPTYVNFSAIEVGKTADIPCDYDGLMGVPISFMDRYNPQQFEIVGTSKTLAKPMSQFAPIGTYQSGGPRFYLKTEDGNFRRMYERIIIKNRLL